MNVLPVGDVAPSGARLLSQLRPGVLLWRRLELGLTQRAAQVIDYALVFNMGVSMIAMDAFTADRIA